MANSTLLPPQPIPEGTTPPQDPGDVAGIQAYEAAVAQQNAFNWNKDLATRYVSSTFASWLVNYSNGKYGPTADPPAVPNGFVVDVTDPWNPTYLQIGPAVCAVPTYTRLPLPSPPGTVAIGVHLAGDYWSMLPNDTAPDGYTTPAPTMAKDGTVGFFQKIMSIFGAGWWKRIN